MPTLTAVLGVLGSRFSSRTSLLFSMRFTSLPDFDTSSVSTILISMSLRTARGRHPWRVRPTASCSEHCARQRGRRIFPGLLFPGLASELVLTSYVFRFTFFGSMILAEIFLH